MIRTISIFVFLLFVPILSSAQYDQVNEWHAGRGYDSTYEVNVPDGANWKQKYVYHGNGDSLAIFDIEHQFVRFYQHYPDEEFISRCPHYRRFQMREDGFEMQEIDHGISTGDYHFLSEKKEVTGRVELYYPAGLWTFRNRENGSTRYTYYLNEKVYPIGYLVILLIAFASLVFTGFLLMKAKRYPQFFISICIVSLIHFLFRIANGITDYDIESDTRNSYKGDLFLVLWDMSPILFYLVFILSLFNLLRAKKYPSIKVVSIVTVSLIPVLQLLYLAALLLKGFGKIGG